MPTLEQRGRRRGASLVVILATLASLAVAAGIAALVLFSGELVRDRIVQEASKRGVELDYEKANFWWTSASLEGVRFRLSGVPGIEGQMETLDVTLSDWHPRRVVAGGLRLSVVGSAANLLVTLSDWTRRHPGAYELPIGANGVALEWRPGASEPPWLVVTEGGFTEGAARTVFTARNAKLSGVDLGAVSAAWQNQNSTISMAFGADDPARAPLSLVVAAGAKPPTAQLTLAPTDVTKLSGPLGVTLPVQGVTARAQVALVLPSDMTPVPIRCHMEATLEGWTPPHPVELGGFIFGNQTVFSTDFVLSSDASTVTLEKSRVQAGAFVLTGGGKVVREGEHATVRMDLSGRLACAEVARSAAAAHVGTFLSTVIGRAAKQVVDGSVAVRVRIAADTRNLAAARVVPTIGIGCGLVPLSTLEPRLRKLLPPEVLALADALPEALPPPGTPWPKPAVPELPTLADVQKRILDAKVPTLPSAFPLPLGLPKPAGSSSSARE